MLPEKSSYQITRYLNSFVDVTSREICKFLIKFHWNIKEDFRILKTHGKNSTEYLERKVLVIPNFGERITFLEAFLLLYYFYKEKHQLNLTYIYNHILDVNFWNVLSTAPLNELLEFCENYSSLKPYTTNTEINPSLIAETVTASGEYGGETDVFKFIDRESSTLSLNSFRPIVLADEDKFYMVHRFQNPYRYNNYSRLVKVTQHNIHSVSYTHL
ncbi:MAG: hypothetical protein N3A69_09330, partial [Leptospiraceae bacterium]|nr:hypothetical protein [Leptospiraceae bacterium]